MVDTVRTYAALQALLADNTTGDISPQDVRDVLLSSLTLFPDHPATLNAADVYWSGSDAAAMTTVTVTGAQTISERVGRLGVAFSGQTSGDANCLLKAHSFSIGDSFAVPITLLANTATNVYGGLIFTDGTTSTSNGVSAHLSWVAATGTITLYTRAGTLTAFTTLSTSRAVKPMGHIWVRLTYVSANTWGKQVSADGLTWSTMGIADMASTLTPTHVGVTWSTDGSATEGAASFGPILKLA